MRPIMSEVFMLGWYPGFGVMEFLFWKVGSLPSGKASWRPTELLLIQQKEERFNLKVEHHCNQFTIPYFGTLLPRLLTSWPAVVTFVGITVESRKLPDALQRCHLTMRCRCRSWGLQVSSFGHGAASGLRCLRTLHGAWTRCKKRREASTPHGDLNVVCKTPNTVDILIGKKRLHTIQFPTQTHSQHLGIS